MAVDDKFPGFRPMPGAGTPAVWIQYLERESRRYGQTQRTYPAVYYALNLALAWYLDAAGRGLDAAERRAAAGRLSLSYRWRHRPTGWLTVPRSTRGNAWRYLSHRSTGEKRLRLLYGRPAADGVYVRVDAVDLSTQWGPLSPFDRGYEKYRAVSGLRYSMELKLTDLELVVTVMSGYRAVVGRPKRPGGPSAWPCPGALPEPSRRL